MTTFPLTLARRQLFTFSPTLDGQVFLGSCPWGLFGQRPYLSISTTSGAAVLYVPLVGTPNPLTIASAQWNELLGVVEVTTSNLHGLPLGWVANWTISGCVPTTYNGLWQVASTGPTTVTYLQMTDPGAPTTTQGVIGQMINLIGGFTNPNTGLPFVSTLVLMESSNQIVVSP